VSGKSGANLYMKTLKANRRISNKKFRMMKCGIASLSQLRISMIEYLTSIFIIPCSIFVIRFSEFIFQFDRLFVWPTAALTPEH